ncbi:Fc.00g012070.m01.CDS01 [Cosmosporella sp. VM-42]
MSASQLGNTQDVSTKLWYREFNRGVSPKTLEPRADTDTVATPEQLENDFVDHWGQKLKNDEEFRKLNTYNELIGSFWKSDDIIVQTYAVADGQTIPKDKQKPWFRSELRFLTLIIPTDENHKKGAKAPITSVSWAPWFVLIAASSYIHSEVDILHIMSWSVDDGQFRYYARDVIMNDIAHKGEHGWVYLCSSMDAFAEDGKAYLGPLNGHVNGGLVMKEIHKPWMHWLVGGRGVLDLLNDDLTKQLSEADWLTYPGFPPLYGASVQSGETLEKVVLDALRVWFTSRHKKDFLNSDGTTSETPDHVQRWAAHFFLSTNINIAATSNNANIVPSDFFFNYEMLRGYSDLLPNSRQKNAEWQKLYIQPKTPKALEEWNKRQKKLENIEDPYSQADWFNNYTIPSFKYDGPSYTWASRELKLCTLQEVKPDAAEITFPRDTFAGGVFMGTLEDGQEAIQGGAEINFAIQQWGEGDNPWVILQSSVEDAMGVWMAQKMFLGEDRGYASCQLFSRETFNALQMVDFWNPVYSWRRVRLMQYIPVRTQLKKDPVFDPELGEDVYTFDLEENFIKAIEDRAARGDLQQIKETPPEIEFLKNLKKPLIDHQVRISKYTSMVSDRLGKSKWVLDYLRLAESRRRMFRPLPMNFFGSNLPYCLGISPKEPWLEMTESGTVQRISDYGVGCLSQWLGSLAGNDPKVLPGRHHSLEDLIETRRSRIKAHKPGTPRAFLPRPATMRMACQRSIAVTNPEVKARHGGCPFLTQPSMEEVTVL